MPKAALTDETVDLPIACIDAQDSGFIVPLREFLASYGCRVIVNPSRHTPAAYYLISGDGEFVKSFLERMENPDQKTLVIISDARVDPSHISPPGEAKVVLVDPRPLTEAQVKEIFTFFFTGSQKIIDLRKSRILTPPKEPISPPARREEISHREDIEDIEKERIAATIAKVFSEPKPEKRPPRPRRWFLPGVLLLITWPLWWLAVSVLVSGLSLGVSSKLLSAGQVERASQLTNLAAASSDQAGMTLGLIAAPLRIVGLDSILRGQEELVSLLSTLARIELGTARMFKLGQGIFPEVLSQTATLPSETALAAALTQLRLEIGSGETSLSLARATLTSLLEKRRFPFNWSPLFQLGLRSQDKLASLSRQLSVGQQLLTLYLHLSGFRQKQTYLVLLQNSMELRPTGGFVGSLALATFENGKLVDLSIQDVYAVDGQLKGHVPPPPPIKEVLGAEHWYLRDSNWDPDFRESGRQAAWFYEKETGVSVDGVIGISLPLIVDLLRLTGPLTLSDFNDKISSENFFAKAIYYTQVDFFPGSTQKKNFLGSLATSLLTTLADSPSRDPQSLWQVLMAGLESRNLLFYFSDQSLGAMVESYGWAGAVAEEEKLCRANMCLADFLYPVEANLGVNKANYFLAREVLDQITISADGLVSHTLTLNYRNSSAGSPDGGGVYRSYTRFLLPKDVVTDSLLLDGAPLPRPGGVRKTAPALPYTELLATPSAYLTLALAFEVPPRGEKQLVVSYRRQKRILPGPSGASLEFFLQKQPGLVNTKWQTVITYPITWEAKPLPDKEGLTPTVAKPGELEYNTNLTRDEWIRVFFSPR